MGKNAEVETTLYVCLDLPTGESVEREYDVTASVTPYDPGRTWGDPEKCYPPEGGDIEDLTVKLAGVEIPEEQWAFLGITKKALDERVMEALEKMGDEDDDPPERDDDWEPKNVYQQDDPNDD